MAGPCDEDFFGLLELSVRPREQEPEGAALLRRLMGGPVKSLRHSNRKRFEAAAGIREIKRSIFDRW